MKRHRDPSSLKSETEPEFIAATLADGWQLLEAGRAQEAMAAAKRLVRLKQTQHIKDFFVQCIKSWSYFPGVEDVQDVIVRALVEPWTLPAELFGISRGILDRDPVVGPAIRRADDAWPKRVSIVELLGPGGLKAVASNLLLRALLESDKAIWPDFEHFLTSLRAGLLDFASAEQRHDAATIRLCCALARQAIINEYVWDQTAEEQTAVEKLIREVNSGSATARAMGLAVLLAYVPVDKLPSRTRNGSWPESVSALFTEAGRERATTRRHADSIRRLTHISDKTSLIVQRQYEQNPYPRWVKLPMFQGALDVDAWFRKRFPHSAYRSMHWTDRLDVLVAGCGTGRQTIELAQTFPHARVLGVDLSLPSLCYARDKSVTMGLRNVDYAQADILELDSLRGSFDIIVSSGVLHHLSSPEEGWNKLLSLLRANGCMQVALYSALGRRNVSVAQKWLARHGYGATLNDIRRARQELMNAGAQEPGLGAVVHFSDFYSTSECRDLLLHSQEICFTIPRIMDFVDRSGISFLGFSTNPAILNQFVASFSPERQTDLRCWHQFETQHPDTFANMYTFWVQQRS